MEHTIEKIFLKLNYVTQFSSKIEKHSKSAMDIYDLPDLMWISRDYKFKIKTENNTSDVLKKFMNSQLNIESIFFNSFKLNIKKKYSERNLRLKWESMNFLEKKEWNEYLNKLKEKNEDTYLVKYENFFETFWIKDNGKNEIFFDWYKKKTIDWNQLKMSLKYCKKTLKKYNGLQIILWKCNRIFWNFWKWIL